MHQTVQELENPFILIHEKKISDMNLLLRALELAVTVSILILFLLIFFHVQCRVNKMPERYKLTR